MLTTASWMLRKDGNRSAYDIGIGVNSTGFLSGKFLRGLVFMLGLGIGFGQGYVGNEFCG